MTGRRGWRAGPVRRYAGSRQVADLLAIEVDPAVARATVESVPFWFHTLALNRAEGIYTPRRRA